MVRGDAEGGKRWPTLARAEGLAVLGIMFEGKAWLAPDWILSPDGKSMKPLRIISLALAHGHKMDLGEAPLAYFRSNPIPRCLIDDGVVPPELEKVFEIREEPEIWLPTPESTH